MALAQRQQVHLAQQGMGRGGPSGLAEVLDVLLDKGLVIDAFVRVSLVGIELLTIDARVVVASVDTYLRFAEAVNRLDLLQAGNSKNLGDLVGSPKKRGDGSTPAALSSPSKRDSAEERDAPQGSAGEAEGEEPAARNEDGDARKDDSEAPDGGNGSGADDDKGLLSRIKERGQVF